MEKLIDVNIVSKQASSVVNKLNTKYKDIDLTDYNNIIKLINTLFSTIKSEEDYPVFEYIVINDLLMPLFEQQSYLVFIEEIKAWLEHTLDMVFNNPLYFLYLTISSKVETEGSQWLITINSSTNAYRFTNENLFYMLSLGLGLSNMTNQYSVIIRKDTRYMASFVAQTTNITHWPTAKDLEQAHLYDLLTGEPRMVQLGLVYNNMKELLPEYFYLMSMVKNTVN